MRCLAVFLCALLFSAQVLADDAPQSSLFFNDTDSRKIEALAARIRPENPDVFGLHLGAVMYYGSGDWALWLQGERWTPDTDKPDLHIIDVSEDEVRLKWISSPGVPARDITLKPYQTYQPSTGKIIEGLR